MCAGIHLDYIGVLQTCGKRIFQAGAENMPLFRKRKAQSKNYHERFSFLMEDERVIRELDPD